MTTERYAVPSPLLGGTADVVVARPASAAEPLPWVWLLHGWGNAVDDVTWLLDGLDAAMAAGDLAPHVVAAPAGPWSATSWWVDSAHDRGLPVETAVLTEVLPDLERTLGAGPPHRDRRVVAGLSMGGGSAIAWALRHPELFGAAALVAPAAFADVPLPEPLVESGPFGVGATAYDPERWTDLLSYRRLLATRPPAAPPLRVATVVGDAEDVSDYPNDTGRSSLTLEAAKLHVALCDAPAVTSSLRVVDGGHTWDFWIPALVLALTLAESRR